MNLNFKLNVTINGEPVTAPIADLKTCCSSDVSTGNVLTAGVATESNDT
jgi:hypothetical protein